MEKLPWETEFDFLKHRFRIGDQKDRDTLLLAFKEHLKTIGPTKQLEFIFNDD